MATENHSMVPEKIRTITKKLIFLLVFEEPDFSIESATISDEFATLTDDTMTRNDDNNWIVVIGSSDSTNCSWRSYLICLFLIAPSFAIRDILKSFPGFFLEV